MRILAILNQKGGVGKTTLVVNLGAALARRRKKVLLVDLDPQAHLTSSLGLATDPQAPSTYHLLSGQATLDQVLVPADKLEVAPASLELSSAESALAGLPSRESLLKKALDQPLTHDFCLLDCPPNLGLLAINALCAAHGILIPVQAEFLALQSLAKLMETIGAVQAQFNPQLKIAGIIAMRYSSRKRLNREVLEKIREHFGRQVCKSTIRENISLAEAPSFGLDIFSYKPSSLGAHDYSQLCAELLRKG